MELPLVLIQLCHDRLGVSAFSPTVTGKMESWRVKSDGRYWFCHLLTPPAPALIINR